LYTTYTKLIIYEFPLLYKFENKITTTVKGINIFLFHLKYTTAVKFIAALKGMLDPLSNNSADGYTKRLGGYSTKIKV